MNHSHTPAAIISAAVAVEDVDLLAGSDQLAEQGRAGDPADAGADGVEEGQGHSMGKISLPVR
jgi:hypothetical protein